MAWVNLYLDNYYLKMATSSGKTKVMALAIVWQYFNVVREYFWIAKYRIKNFMVF
ncbi:MAG: hypothetical protein ABFS56_05050 [Pseudomonadota bacterium]